MIPVIQTNTSPTLDGLFKRILARKPDAPALLDPINKQRITGQPPRNLTFAEADRAITALSAHFIESGLPSNSVIAVQLPNTVEFVLTVLAAHRAGLVVALFISHRRGIYFAFMTIAFGQVFWFIAIKSHAITGGEDGLTFKLPVSLAPGTKLLVIGDTPKTKGDNVPNCVKRHLDDVAADEVDAETTPLRDPDHYRYDIDTAKVSEAWRRGTVIRSWLLDLMTYALGEDPHLEAIEGYAEDSGEGRWTVNAAVDLAVPVPTIAASLFARFVSRQDDSPAMKMVAAMRNQFGGHAVVLKPEPGATT